MKKSLFLILFVGFFTSFAMGSEFLIRYQALSSGSIFYVETKYGKPVGKIVRNCQKQEVSFSVYGNDDELWTHAEMGKIESENRVQFFRADGLSLGSFAAEFCNLYPSEYHIYSSQNELTSKGYVNWLGNHLVLTHPDNPKHLFVTFSRPMFKLFNDNWHFQIHEPDQIDFSILCVIGVFQTACDLSFEKSDQKKERSLSTTPLAFVSPQELSQYPHFSN